MLVNFLVSYYDISGPSVCYLVSRSSLSPGQSVGQCHLAGRSVRPSVARSVGGSVAW